MSELIENQQIQSIQTINNNHFPNGDHISSESEMA